MRATVICEDYHPLPVPLHLASPEKEEKYLTSDSFDKRNHNFPPNHI